MTVSELKKAAEAAEDSGHGDADVNVALYAWFLSGGCQVEVVRASNDAINGFVIHVTISERPANQDGTNQPW